MKVAIDIQSTVGKRTGFGNYVLGLLEGFKQASRAPEFVCLKHGRKVAMRTLGRILWDQIEFPFKAWSKKPDLVHKPCFAGPIFYRGPLVLTVHDIITYIYPKNISATSRIYWNGVFISSIKTAKIIITASEASKRDFVNLLGVDSARVHVIYHGIFDSFKPRETAEARCGLHSLKLPSRYFMCVGSLEPRKNLPMIIKTYLSVAGKIQEDLVIVGKPAWGLKELDSVLKGHKFQNRVCFLGYVGDDQLPLLYNAATGLLFPSLYEGFGLPPLEAMASGCPVVCSNTSSVPEVVGDAGLLLDPKEESLWSDAILRLSEDPSLREKMSNGGIQRAENFTWKECAEKTMAVYEKALSSY